MTRIKHLVGLAGGLLIGLAVTAAQVDAQQSRPKPKPKATASSCEAKYQRCMSGWCKGRCVSPCGDARNTCRRTGVFRMPSGAVLK